MNNIRLESNKALLRGKIKNTFVFDHETRGEVFYRCDLEIMRLSGNYDVLPITVSERICNVTDYNEGDFIEVIGQIRSYNTYKPDGKNSLKIFGFAKEIKKLEYDCYTNEITIRGFLCKPPIFRVTPYERKITDLLVAVNRLYGKSDYIPTIVWGRNAIYAKGLPVGTELILKGRFQSRNYSKTLENGEKVERTALELSINVLNVVKESESEETSKAPDEVSFEEVK